MCALKKALWFSYIVLALNRADKAIHCPCYWTQCIRSIIRTNLVDQFDIVLFVSRLMATLVNMIAQKYPRLNIICVLSSCVNTWSVTLSLASAR